MESLHKHIDDLNSVLQHWPNQFWLFLKCCQLITGTVHILELKTFGVLLFEEAWLVDFSKLHFTLFTSRL